jgi:hypothetical protein
MAERLEKVKKTGATSSKQQEIVECQLNVDEQSIIKFSQFS